MDTHQKPDKPLPLSPSPTPHSDSGFSFSSSSSSEIMGTPFDLGAQRFEYPFPQAQGSPTDPFLPLSSSITPHSHPHAQLPPWPIHISKSFPLTPPPLGKFKAHPKLRPSSVREPPVPPGLVKRRSRIPGLQHQSSSEEPSDRSDVGDQIPSARKSPRIISTFTKIPFRHPIQPSPSDMLPIKQATSLPTGSFDRPTVDVPAGLVIDAPSAEGTPRTPATFILSLSPSPDQSYLPTTGLLAAAREENDPCPQAYVLRDTLLLDSGQPIISLDFPFYWVVFEGLIRGQSRSHLACTLAQLYPISFHIIFPCTPCTTFICYAHCASFVDRIICSHRFFYAIFDTVLFYSRTAPNMIMAVIHTLISLMYH